MTERLLGERKLILTDEETERVMLAFLKARVPGGATTREMKRVVRWAAQAKVDGELFRMVLRGDVWPELGPKGLRFRLPGARRDEGEG